ncbi:PepSY domain-containing protein [Waltera sp.]|uniref:PepSY domain-containing protein n=1 Tax=Waltera sp. TaxID=2815806 RepID=UPI003AB97FE8
MMKRKLILTGAALSLAVAMTGCGGKPVINQQPSSQEKNEVDTQAQTEATVPAADSATTQSSAAATAQTVTGTVDEEMAQKIALEHAGVKATDATITKSKLDYEGRRQVYEIEWYAGGKKYDYEIAVDTGEILSSAYDEKTSGWSVSNSSNVTVSEADAKQTALGRVSAATQKDIYEWKFDYDDGRPEYEGKIIYGGTEYDFTIDASSGAVIEWEAESVR